MSDLLVFGELDLDRGAQRAHDLGDVVGLVVDEADPVVLGCAAGRLQGIGRGDEAGPSHHEDESSALQLMASGSARYSLTTKPSGLTNRSVADMGALT